MKKTVPLFLSLLILYSCNQDETLEPSCNICGKWNLDSLYTSNGMGYPDSGTYERWEIRNDSVIRQFHHQNGVTDTEVLPVISKTETSLTLPISGTVVFKVHSVVPNQSLNLTVNTSVDTGSYYFSYIN